jgi:type IV pilus assembly protein PilQ
MTDANNTNRTQVERAESMSAYNAQAARGTAILKRIATVAAAAALAAGSSLVLSASSTPVRLVGISAAGNAILIEATEPVAYSVSRPDALTLVVDMRNVVAGDARNDVRQQGAIAGVEVEQASAIDGRAIARVRLALTRPAEYKVRSARNTIRVELTPSGGAAAAAAKAEVPPASTPGPVVEKNAAAPAPAPAAPAVPATAIERIRSSRLGDATVVTLIGDGHLAPARVTESDTAPRRLILDFPNVISRAPSSTDIGSTFVKRVRVGLNSSQPLITRVVMEIDQSAMYHVQRDGDAGRDLSVVFTRAQADSPVLIAPLEAPGAAEPPEPPITLEQAIANASAITPPPAVDPIAALNLVAPPVSRSEEAAAATPRATQQQKPSPATASPAEILASVQQQSGPPENAPATVRPPAPKPATPQKPPAAPPSQTMAPSAPPSAPLTTPQLIGNQGQKAYTGHPISLDFTGGDLRTVLRLFAEVSGLNMIIDPDVQGTVDIVLTDVPWDQALEVILRGNQLDYTVDGTIVRVARIETLKREQEQRQALAKSQADAGTLVVRTFPLSYARAAQAAPLVRKAALSARGDVQIDERTNTLIITDLPGRLDTAAQLIGTLDRAEPQVEVEARIVQTNRDFARAIGVQWGLNGRMSPELGNTTNLAFPNRGSIGGRLGDQGAVGTDPRANPVDQSGTAVNLGAPAATSAIGLALGAVNGAFNLDVALSALESSGKGRILSTPRLTTQNNIEAEVSQGVQIPIQTVANNTVTVTFKDAVLILRVTPQITAANTVIMKIQIENATADFSREVNGIPPIDTQRANTQVQINDGATTVIGGIFVTREQSNSDRTPLLHRIPLFGWLFRRESMSDESRELLIFITPRILRG